MDTSLRRSRQFTALPPLGCLKGVPVIKWTDLGSSCVHIVTCSFPPDDLDEEYISGPTDVC